MRTLWAYVEVTLYGPNDLIEVVSEPKGAVVQVGFGGPMRRHSCARVPLPACSADIFRHVDMLSPEAYGMRLPRG